MARSRGERTNGEEERQRRRQHSRPQEGPQERHRRRGPEAQRGQTPLHPDRRAGIGRPGGGKDPDRVAYERRNRDLDPQLVWRGKDQQDWSDLVVQAPPLYVQEKVHPEVLVNDLIRQSKLRKKEDAPAGPDLFADFNGLPDEEARAEFYKHDANWSNRMILGDSLQ